MEVRPTNMMYGWKSGWNCVWLDVWVAGWLAGCLDDRVEGCMTECLDDTVDGHAVDWVTARRPSEWLASDLNNRMADSYKHWHWYFLLSRTNQRLALNLSVSSETAVKEWGSYDFPPTPNGDAGILAALNLNWSLPTRCQLPPMSFDIV
jgi:hypothetical protein